MWLPTLAAGVGAGLIGNSFHHGYGQSEDYQRLADTYLGQSGQDANQWNDIGRNELNNYGVDNAASRAATQNYARYLQQDPGTDQNDAAYLAKATGGTTAAYMAARARIQAAAQKTGAYTPDSATPGGSYTGANTAVDLAQAGTMANAQNNLANLRTAQRQGRIGQLAALYTGQAGADFNTGMDATGQANADWMNLSRMYNGQAQQSAARTSAYNAGIDKTAQGIGAMLGYGLSGGGAYGSQPGDTIDPYNHGYSGDGGYPQDPGYQGG